MDNMTVQNSQKQKRPRIFYYLKWVLIALLVVAAAAQLFPFRSGEQPAILWGRVCEGKNCSAAAVLRGPIPENANPILAQLQRRADVKTLCFESLGGHSSGGRELAVWLDDHGYDTCVPKVRKAQAFCASACTVAFIGGHQRRVDPGVNFAIHGAYMRVLLSEPPDVSDGTPGQFRFPSQPWLGISLAVNKGTAWIELTTLRVWTRPSEQRDRLLAEVGQVPGHLVKRVTTADLVHWKTVTVPPAVPLVFYPEGPAAPEQP
nr:hypothetical protein [Polaromonas sp. JS666]